jgi:hypothetical protein
MVEKEKQKAVKAKAAIRTAAREPFNIEGLLKRIVRFIVADDQESIFLHLWSSSSNTTHSYSLSGFRNVRNFVKFFFSLARRLMILTYTNVTKITVL